MMRFVILVALAVPFPKMLAFQAAPDALAEARTSLAAAQYTKAAELYSAGVAKEPANAEAYYGVVRALLGARRATEAYTYAEQALQHCPQTVEAENAAGLAMFRKGDLASAEAHFRAALKLHVNDSGALLGMASIYSVVSKNKTARAFAMRAYGQDPNDPHLMLTRANTLKGPARILALQRVLALLDPASEEARELTTRIALDQATAGRELRRLTTPYDSAQIKLFRIMEGPNRWRGVGLRVQFNQRQTIRLLLDTGASSISLSPKAAEKAGLQILGDRAFEAHGIGDDKAGSVLEYLASEVTVGSVSFADFPVAVFRGAQSPDFDGLIGADVFRRFIVGIDLAEPVLSLDPRPGDPAAEDEVADSSDTMPAGFVRVYRFGNHLALPTSVNGGDATIFLVDTGASTNLIDAAVARQASFVYGAGRTIVKGVQGKVDDVARARRISLVFAGFRQDNSDVLAIDLEKMSNDFGVGFSGILGMPVLGQMKLTIDYREGRIRMEPRPVPLH
jgi:tetratricopeptide (TPR) repeat protein